MRLPCWLPLALVFVSASSFAQSDKPVVRVATVVDGPSPVFDQEITSLTDAIRDQLSDRFAVELVRLDAEGDWTTAGANSQLDEAYANPDIAAVFGFGHLTIRAVGERRTLPKPTILPYVLEGRRQGLPRRGDISGKRNLSYIDEDFDVTDEAGYLRRIAGAKSIVVLAERSQEDVVSTINEEGLRVVVADPSVEALFAAIPPTTDGVVLSPMRRLSIEDRRRLMALITRRQIPNIAIDPAWLGQGAMMSIRSPNNYARRAQRAALNLDLILEGRPASEMHVDFEERLELQINMEAMRAIGVRPTFDVLIDAELLHEEESAEEGRIRMGAAMLEAVDTNLDLAVAEKFVEAGEERVKAERGPLLPQAQVQSGVTVRDPYRVPPGGFLAQYQGSTFASASQSIYSAQAWARFATRKHLQEGREYGYFVNVLDVLLATGTAYVAVLRAKAEERIQRKNIRLTREYLELARLRLEVGVANASELYRWQSELSKNQQAVVEARARVGQSKVELNRVLNRPLRQPIAPLDLPTDEEGFTLPPEDPIAKYMSDPWSFDRLSDFMVSEGLRNSPQARGVAAREAAFARLKKGRTMQLWLPDFFIEGAAQHDYWIDGAGSEAPQVPAGFEGLFPEFKKGTWSVGAYAAIPLSRGGTGVAEMREAARLTERYNRELALVEQQIDKGVRTELYNAGAALASVTLTRKAAEAARSNLQLVVDLYQRGKVDIIRLTDAQTQSLISNLAAANAAYDYLLALLFVNREISHFRNLDDEEARRDFARRLNEFVLAAESATSPALTP